MAISVIGAGIGRTGTYSLKLALEKLGFGRCHHMEEVLHNMPVQIPLWDAAARGQPDWAAIYDGYGCAVDWPTAAFYRELNAVNPHAKFILTHRSSESWLRSFSETIYKLMNAKEPPPPPMQPFMEMAGAVLGRNGVRPGLDEAALVRMFEAHNDTVRKSIPADRLLVYQVKEGWEPLCGFLGVPVPNEPFPRSNDQAEFWTKVSSAR